MLSGAAKKRVGSVNLLRSPPATQKQPLQRRWCRPPGLQKILPWQSQLVIPASVILTTREASKGLIKADPPHCSSQSTSGRAVRQMSWGTPEARDQLPRASPVGSAHFQEVFWIPGACSHSRAQKAEWLRLVTRSFSPASATLSATASAVWNSCLVQHGAALPFEKDLSKCWGVRLRHLLSTSLRKPEQPTVVPLWWWLKEKIKPVRLTFISSGGAFLEQNVLVFQSVSTVTQLKCSGKIPLKELVQKWVSQVSSGCL